MDQDREWMGIALAMLATSQRRSMRPDTISVARTKPARSSDAAPSGKRAAVKAARRQSRQQKTRHK